MSQLGRCTCGNTLIKAKIWKEGKQEQVDICPTCSILQLETKVEKKLDKFGLEELKK